MCDAIKRMPGQVPHRADWQCDAVQGAAAQCIMGAQATTSCYGDAALARAPRGAAHHDGAVIMYAVQATFEHAQAKHYL